MKDKKIASLFFTLIVILILIVSAPASAITVTISGDAAKDLSLTDTLAVAAIAADIEIASGEIINIGQYAIKITDNESSTLAYCLIDVTGNELEGCDYIDNVNVDVSNSNYTYGDYHGYGFTTSGNNEEYGDLPGYGYGQGHTSGPVNEITISFDWEFQKQARPAGKYYVNLEAYAVNGAETRLFTSSSPHSFTVNAKSVNEIVESSVNDTAVNAGFGDGEILIPANVSYISTDSIPVELQTYLKGIVGIEGNVTINFTIGASAGGVSFNDVTSDPNDSIFFFLDINGDIDPDLGYADIYIGIPKSMVDTLVNSTGKSISTVFSTMNVYIKHSDNSTQTLTLTRAEDLDTATEYLFKVTVTSLSTFVPYHSSATSSQDSNNGGYGKTSNRRYVFPPALITGVETLPVAVEKNQTVSEPAVPTTVQTESIGTTSQGETVPEGVGAATSLFGNILTHPAIAGGLALFILTIIILLGVLGKLPLFSRKK